MFSRVSPDGWLVPSFDILVSADVRCRPERNPVPLNVFQQANLRAGVDARGSWRTELQVEIVVVGINEERVVGGIENVVVLSRAARDVFQDVVSHDDIRC